jgi:hypothetical protein
MISNNSIGNLGRLGNQMFQYASLRGIASKFNYEYCLPPSSFVGTRDPNCARSDFNIFQCFKLPEVERKITDNIMIEESSFNFDENIWNNCPDNVDLFGYFQTEKYFNHIKEELKNDFTFIEEISNPCDELLESEFGDSDILSLHVRRGDYLNYSHHPVQDINYYKLALSHFDNDIPVIVFSDDIEWCKSQKIFESNRFTMSEENNTAVDLYLQSKCNNHIICNSSFSWWGAWLSNSKKVVAPKKWFGPPLTHNTDDLYCKEWVQC